MANHNQFLTTAEFATKAGISTSSVTKMIRAGKIKAEKPRRRFLADSHTGIGDVLSELGELDRAPASQGHHLPLPAPGRGHGGFRQGQGHQGARA